MITKANEKANLLEKFPMRVGRGAIQDVEIREVGQPIVFGEIPGVVAIVGCANYPAGGEDVARIAEEFLRRRFIVVASGCSAMNIAMTLPLYAGRKQDSKRDRHVHVEAAGLERGDGGAEERPAGIGDGGQCDQRRDSAAGRASPGPCPRRRRPRRRRRAA